MASQLMKGYSLVETIICMVLLSVMSLTLITVLRTISNTTQTIDQAMTRAWDQHNVVNRILTGGETQSNNNIEISQQYFVYADSDKDGDDDIWVEHTDTTNPFLLTKRTITVTWKDKKTTLQIVTQ